MKYHDPHVPSFSEHGLSLESVIDLDQAVYVADCVVIVTDHSGYDWRAISGFAKLIVDTRNVT